MNTHQDEAQETIAILKRIKRVLIGAGVAVIALSIGSLLITLASFAGLVGHDSAVHELGQVLLALDAGIGFMLAALLRALTGGRKQAPAPVR